VKVGVIGIGNMGWHHARVLSLLKDAELVGVADPDPDRGQAGQGTVRLPAGSLIIRRHALAEVEAVCIAVPTLLHHSGGIWLACESGVCMCLIEKADRCQPG